jgi:hypothetical protein
VSVSRVSIAKRISLKKGKRQFRREKKVPRDLFFFEKNCTAKKEVPATHLSRKKEKQEGHTSQIIKISGEKCSSSLSSFSGMKLQKEKKKPFSP